MLRISIESVALTLHVIVSSAGFACTEIAP
jgi:hypothetical protein